VYRGQQRQSAGGSSRKDATTTPPQPPPGRAGVENARHDADQFDFDDDDSEVRLTGCFGNSFNGAFSSRSSTLGPGAQPPPQKKIVAGPPNLAVLLTHCDQLILRKISKFDATRCQILRLKYTKIDFRWGSAQTPLEELRRSSSPLAVFKLHTSKGRDGEEEGQGNGEGIPARRRSPIQVQTRAFQFAIQIDSILFVMRIDWNHIRFVKKIGLSIH